MSCRGLVEYRVPGIEYVERGFAVAHPDPPGDEEMEAINMVTGRNTRQEHDEPKGCPPLNNACRAGRACGI